MVNKGASLIGHVTEVQQKTKAEATSKVSVIFDSLQNGKMSMPISATIVSLTQVQSSANINDNAQADVFGSSSSSASTQSSGGSSSGLLGSVGNTVGSVVNTTTSTVGGVTNTVGSTTNTLGGTLKGIQISQSTDVSAEGSSTLSLQKGNLKLEKGTTFNLRLTESASVNSTSNKAPNQ